MFMKKKYIIITISILLILTTCLYVFMGDNTKRIVISNEESKKLTNNNALTMMYETEAGSGEYQVTSDTTWPQEGYVFNDRLSKCENGSELSWDDENNRVIMEANTSDKCYVYFDKEPDTLLNYIIGSIFTGTDGDNGLYYHDGAGTYGAQEAGDNSYRFSGANPNNYVCFGTNESTCPDDNLYRIIGAFDDDNDSIYQLKLIKADYINSDMLGTNGDYNSDIYDNASSSYYKGSKLTINRYYWNDVNYDLAYDETGYRNVWSYSELNKTNLNTNYLNNMGNEWSSKIATVEWNVGGNTLVNIYDVTVKNTYINEIVNSNNNVEKHYNAKIGLMYVSDYGYAASPENWNTTLKDYDNDMNRNNNWMYMGLSEWTISPRTDQTYSVFYVNQSGDVNYGNGVGSFRYAIRPTFYLNSDVWYLTGDGTKSNPYRIH